MTKHLAFFLPSLDGGGAERIALMLAGQFASMGYKCDMVIAIRKGKLLSSVPSNVRLIVLDKQKTLDSFFALAAYLRREKPDVLMATVFSGNIAACLAYLLSGCSTRLVLGECSLPDYDAIGASPTQTLLNKLSARLLYRCAAASIAISTGVKQSLIREKLISPERIHVIPYPVDNPYQPHDPQLDGKIPELIACGRLVPQKDHATLIKAFAQVRKSCPAKLTILGEGPLLPSLQALVKEHGVEDSVTFAGFVYPPEEQMRRASIFVHTAIYEGFGVVLLEALASGCNVVATDCPGGVRDILGDSQYGALVPVGDVAAISEAVISVLNGTRSFPSPEAHLRSFSLEHIADRYLPVLLPGQRQSMGET
ncbi:glycosyltransferase [Dyella acidiphila]|uniref:Glycosyltransferase n=1 Tax=Dyella acidiphila TaxID=2775866 RepID=A0ABR9G8U0_9GAMM|nr:glycosyltransferase [Dyella acidiphila]MBE1160434.1 glycosyltransferase [Dyella acidiphila]